MFGHMIHSYSRFTLTGIGCSIWITAVMLSGLSYYTKSYVFLLFARIISGFGEASMQCTIPPWIQAAAKPSQRGLWLGIFYTAIPVGTALGYAYSALIATALGWQWAFFFEGFLMVPFVAFMFYIAPYFPCDHAASELEKEQRQSLLHHQYNHEPAIPEDTSHLDTHHSTIVEATSPYPSASSPSAGAGSPLHMQAFPPESPSVPPEQQQDGDHPAPGPPSIKEELYGVISQPVFIFITLAAAAQAAVLIGISTFGAAFVMGLGFFNTEAEASTVFGIVISVAGMIATPLGGVVIDRLLTAPSSSSSSSSNAASGVNDDGEIVEAEELNTGVDHADPALNRHALYRLSLFVSSFTLVGGVLLCSCVVIQDRGAFLTVLGLGAGLVLATNPAMNMGVMLCVEREYRAFAIAINIVCLHAFGDVPAPVIVGLIKDTLAPHCVADSGADDDNIAASPECRAQANKLRITMFIAQLWLVWVVLSFLAAAYLTRPLKHRQESVRTSLLSRDVEGGGGLRAVEGVKTVKVSGAIVLHGSSSPTPSSPSPHHNSASGHSNTHTTSASTSTAAGAPSLTPTTNALHHDSLLPSSTASSTSSFPTSPLPNVHTNGNSNSNGSYQFLTVSPVPTTNADARSVSSSSSPTPLRSLSSDLHQQQRLQAQQETVDRFKRLSREQPSTSRTSLDILAPVDAKEGSSLLQQLQAEAGRNDESENSQSISNAAQGSKTSNKKNKKNGKKGTNANANANNNSKSASGLDSKSLIDIAEL